MPTRENENLDRLTIERVTLLLFFISAFDDDSIRPKRNREKPGGLTSSSHKFYSKKENGRFELHIDRSIFKR